MNPSHEIDRLVLKLHHPHHYVRFNAANALAEFGEDALQPLLEVLVSSLSEGARSAAAFSLGLIQSELAVTALIDALELGAADPPTPVAEYACLSLEKIGTARALRAAQRWRSTQRSDQG
ncbi:MAG: HEAT repeat domain-containing protein [Anaerolineae bacterium]|nr:HEAT repeat domain-containing protein [Anaerolineae bacterium]